MKSLKQRITNGKIAMMSAATMGMTAVLTNPVFADVNANTFMGRILGFIAVVVKYVGYGTLAVGIVSFIMGFIGNDMDKQKVITFCIIGVACIAIEGIFTFLMKDTGVKPTTDGLKL